MDNAEKQYLEVCINDRGFVNKPAQVSKIAPTLRAQDHGNQPKVIEFAGGGTPLIVDDTYGFDDPDGISPTLTAVSGGTHHIKIFDVSRFRVRKLTPTEYGRLQAFPVDDGWEQVVSDSQAYKQFGNAVTKNVVTAIGKNIKAFLDRNLRRAEPNIPRA